MTLQNCVSGREPNDPGSQLAPGDISVFGKNSHTQHNHGVIKGQCSVRASQLDRITWVTHSISAWDVVAYRHNSPFLQELAPLLPFQYQSYGTVRRHSSYVLMSNGVGAFCSGLPFVYGILPQAKSTFRHGENSHLESPLASLLRFLR